MREPRRRVIASHLNYGSGGPCSSTVQAELQRCRQRGCADPTPLLTRELAEFLGCRPESLGLGGQTRQWLSRVAESLNLGPGDEVLAPDQEHWVVVERWRELARSRGFVYRQASFEQDWSDRVHSRTRVLFFSHIAPESCALRPARAWCEEARRQGILSLVDGAHGPGQVDLDLQGMGPDFYAGCLHKWVGAPYGSAFLYARSAPLPEAAPQTLWPVLAAARLALQEWRASDLSLARELARRARARLMELGGRPLSAPWDGTMLSCLFSSRLEPEVFADELRARGVEALVLRYRQGLLVRVGFRPEHGQRDLGHLEQALEQILQPLPGVLRQPFVPARPLPSMAVFSALRRKVDDLPDLSPSQDVEALTRHEFFTQTGYYPEQLRGLRVLDAGCGSGRFMRWLSGQVCQLVGMDLDPVGLARCRQDGLHCVSGDLFEPPFEPASFDFIYSLGVLHHTADPERAFRSLVRLLKPGGQIAVWVYPRQPATPLSDLLRPFTTRLPTPLLCALAVVVTALYGPLLRWPGWGSKLQGLLYRARLPWHLSWQWRIHSFLDWYGPTYQFKVSPEELKGWFERAGLEVVGCSYASSARGRKPL